MGIWSLILLYCSRKLKFVGVFWIVLVSIYLFCYIVNMASSEVVAYIAKLRTQKVPDTRILEKLLESGWDKNKAQALLDSSVDDLPPAPSPTFDMEVKKSVIKGSMWDAFEHILLFIGLYVLSISITLTLLMFVDHWFTNIDDLSSYSDVWSSQWQNSMLRGYISAMIVSYPVFSFFFYRVTKRTLSNPQLRSLKSRKFLIYFTLVVTFIIMLGYIINAIYSFLNGNITMNFVLRILTILGVSGSIFAYYLYQVREDRNYE